MPAGIINLAGTIGDEEWKLLKRTFNNDYGTVQNAGKTFFIKNSKVDFVKVGTNLSEIDLKALKEMTRDDIMAMFGVSKPILGIFDDVNLASAKTAKYVFTSEIVDPEMDMLTDALQSELEIWNPNYVLDHASPVPQDDDAELKEIEVGVNKYMTIDEAREKRGLKPLPNGLGATLYVPLNVVPIDQIGGGMAPVKALKGNEVRVEKKKIASQVAIR
jgi:phage portal protein BeeE